MKANYGHPGECKLCGEFKKLTFEHVPPEKSFNHFPVKEFSLSDSMDLMTGNTGRYPWQTEGLKYKINQKGSGGYYLCESCNNNTGSWYIEEYTKLTSTLHYMIVTHKPEINSLCGFILDNLHPLRIYKAILTMFCDINYDCFGDENLRRFLLEKESNVLEGNKYSLYLFLVAPGMRRINGVTVHGDITQINSMVTQTEISSYPLGAVLYLDKPENVNVPGICIDNFKNCNYNDVCSVEFNRMPYFEINSYFPGDYRSKNEIKLCREENEEWSKKQCLNNHQQ